MWYYLKIKKPQEEPDLKVSFILAKENLEKIINAAVDFINAAYDCPVYLTLEDDYNNKQEYLITPNGNKTISEYIKLTAKLDHFSFDFSKHYADEIISLLLKNSKNFEVEKDNAGARIVFDFQPDFCSTFDFLSSIDENVFSSERFVKSFSVHLSFTEDKKFSNLLFYGNDLKVIPFVGDFFVKFAKVLQAEEVNLNIDIYWYEKAYQKLYVAKASVEFAFEYLF